MWEATRSCSYVAACVAMLAGLAATAHAALPPGAPHLRTARSSDTRSRPSAYEEWWDLRVLDPHSDATVTLTFSRNPNGSGLLVRAKHSGQTPIWQAYVGGKVTATARAISVAASPQASGSGRVSFTRRGAAIRLTGGGLSAHVTLRRARRGPAALGFRLGRSQLTPQLVPRAGLSWAMPIASSIAKGSIDVGGTHFGLGGWLVSYEHTWGDLIEGDRAWDYWDDWVVHRGGQTWIAYGLNRSDTDTGPGAREAMWLGLLARVTPGGMSLCRPRIDRRGWVADFYTLPVAFAGRLRARCPHLRADFSDIPARRNFGDIPEFSGVSGPARLAGHGAGWVVHRVTG